MVCQEGNRPDEEGNAGCVSMAQRSRAEEPGAKLICDLSQDSQLSFPSEEEAKDKGR